MRNLPTGAAGAAFDPVVVALVGDLQQDPKHGRIGLGGELVGEPSAELRAKLAGSEVPVLFMPFLSM
jgi:hypothetical protein